MFCTTFFRIIRIISEKWEQNGSTGNWLYPVLFNLFRDYKSLNHGNHLIPNTNFLYHIIYFRIRLLCVFSTMLHHCRKRCSHVLFMHGESLYEESKTYKPGGDDCKQDKKHSNPHIGRKAGRVQGSETKIKKLRQIIHRSLHSVKTISYSTGTTLMYCFLSFPL